MASLRNRHVPTCRPVGAWYIMAFQPHHPSAWVITFWISKNIFIYYRFFFFFSWKEYMYTNATKAELYLTSAFYCFYLVGSDFQGLAYHHTTTAYELTQSVKNFDFAANSKAQIPWTWWSCIHFFLFFSLFFSFFFFIFFLFFFLSLLFFLLLSFSPYSLLSVTLCFIIALSSIFSSLFRCSLLSVSSPFCLPFLPCSLL